MTTDPVSIDAVAAAADVIYGWNVVTEDRARALLIAQSLAAAGWLRTAEDRASGAAMIAVERRRQVDAEGWTPDHDDEHGDAALTRAAMCYADHAAAQVAVRRGRYMPTWPWLQRYWKPSDDPVRNLVKAGALIAAEIDRLRRVAAGGTGPWCVRCNAEHGSTFEDEQCRAAHPAGGTVPADPPEAQP